MTSKRFLGPTVLLLLSASGGTAAFARSQKPLVSAPASTNDENGSTHIYHVGNDVTPPKVTSAPDPDFPWSVRWRKGSFDGICVVGLIVDSSGMPQKVHIVRSLAKDFDKNAMKAVRTYRFSPALRNGEPVAVDVNVEIHFRKD